MIADAGQESIGNDELLARFILKKCWIRSSNHTVKPDAFIPYPYPDLSVTQHNGLSDEEIWKIGQNIADARLNKEPNVDLKGRADLLAKDVRTQLLNVIPAPIPDENMNHANITGWPKEKPAQKIIAQQLVAVAQYKQFQKT